MIYYDLTEDDDLPRGIYQKIISGIDNLVDIGLIKILKTGKYHFIIDKSNLVFDSQKEGFLTIDSDEVLKIFTEDKDNFKLLQYYVVLISTISSNTSVNINGKSIGNIVGNYPLKRISLLANVSEKTAYKYNAILEDLKLIYVYRYMHRPSNSDHYQTNIYGRYCNKICIESYVINNLKFLPTDDIITHRKEVNYRRSMTQKYLAMVKNGKKYPTDVTKNVYNFIIAENEKYQNLYESSGDETYLSKIRDVGIFDKYDFLPENWEDDLFD